MKIEIILLLLIGSVFFIDFLIKGIKKKKSSTEASIEKEGHTPNKKIIIFLLIVFFGILISLIGSYFTALYYGAEKEFLSQLKLEEDIINIIQQFHFINCLIYFSIYLALITIYRNIYKNKTIQNSFGILKYLTKRKKNTSLFLIIVPTLKVILHYVLYPITNKQLGRYVSNSTPYRVSFGEHINSIFDKELFLFIPSIFILLFIVWFFNDKIKAR